MGSSGGGGSNTTPQAYTWTPAPPGKPEFTATPTAAMASTGATATQGQAKTAGGNNSYTGTVLGA